jgi:hypothetical protein
MINSYAPSVLATGWETPKFLNAKFFGSNARSKFKFTKTINSSASEQLSSSQAQFSRLKHF